MVARVLTVDDEPGVLNFLTRLFEDAGHQTVAASDGKSGLREFFTTRPDVAVVDVVMPDMDGLELCRRIREVSYMPVIALTAVDRIDQKVKTFAAGADDYVTKPVSGRGAGCPGGRLPPAGPLAQRRGSNCQLLRPFPHRGFRPPRSVCRRTT